MPRELQDVRVLGVVAADPDVALVVDRDAVVRIGPLVPFARAAPVPHHVALRVELEHRRRRHAAVDRHLRVGRRLDLPGVERGGAVHDPDVVAVVHRYAYGRTNHPVVGQRPGPQRVDLEDRSPGQPLGLRGGPAFQRRLADAERDQQCNSRDATPEPAVLQQVPRRFAYMQLRSPLAARGESPASHRDRPGARLTRRDEGAYSVYVTPFVCTRRPHGAAESPIMSPSSTSDIRELSARCRMISRSNLIQLRMCQVSPQGRQAARTGCARALPSAEGGIRRGPFDATMRL